LRRSRAAAWGLGRPTGVDLPGERGGVVPGRAWKREFWADFRGTYCSEAATAAPGSDVQALYADLCDNGHRWRGGDAVNMVIGQGDVQTTPLQIANAFAAMANGGTLWRPHVAREVIRPDGTVESVPPEAVGRLPLPPPLLDYLESGLVAVTRTGTAASVFGDFPLAVAGKTGTAEIRPKQPFAWFAAYAPAEAPRYVVVVMVEEGGSGSQTAAPIVRRILEGLLGLEQTAITPGLRTD
ncbi:MAG TPA: penicillin-binding transpeptidase domain-containing protein, partial [Egibacteraceae bacterium]|nr:penicillin-binding transpeptidase domain-containing protein [Egibacteraceae bacterium]